jgi:DNA mismatch repair protein MSH6
MARGIEGNEISTPKPTVKKTVASSKSEKGQRSIVSFFQKAATSTPAVPSSSARQSTKHATSPLTPAPSSDAVDPPSPEHELVNRSKNKENGLPSPVTPVENVKDADRIPEGVDGKLDSSPTRKVRCSCCGPSVETLLNSAQAKKTVSYAESDSEDDEVLKPLLANGSSTRPSKRRKFSLEDSDDEFEVDATMEEAMAEAGLSFNLLTAVQFSSSNASDIDDAQRILMTSLSPMIRKRKYHDLRNGKGHHPQMSPNKHHVRLPNRASVMMTEIW